jgi:hypothetical protein
MRGAHYVISGAVAVWWSRMVPPNRPDLLAAHNTHDIHAYKMHTTEQRGLEMPCFTVGFVVELHCLSRLPAASRDYLLPPTTTSLRLNLITAQNLGNFQKKT